MNEILFVKVNGDVITLPDSDIELKGQTIYGQTRVYEKHPLYLVLCMDTTYVSLYVYDADGNLYRSATIPINRVKSLGIDEIINVLIDVSVKHYGA